MDSGDEELEKLYGRNDNRKKKQESSEEEEEVK